MVRSDEYPQAECLPKDADVLTPPVRLGREPTKADRPADGQELLAGGDGALLGPHRGVPEDPIGIGFQGDGMGELEIAPGPGKAGNEPADRAPSLSASGADPAPRRSSSPTGKPTVPGPWGDGRNRPALTSSPSPGPGRSFPIAGVGRPDSSEPRPDVSGPRPSARGDDPRAPRHGREDAFVAVFPADPVAKADLTLDDLEDLPFAFRLAHGLGLDDDAVSRIRVHPIR